MRDASACACAAEAGGCAEGMGCCSEGGTSPGGSPRFRFGPTPGGLSVVIGWNDGGPSIGEDGGLPASAGGATGGAEGAAAFGGDVGITEVGWLTASGNSNGGTFRTPDTREKCGCDPAVGAAVLLCVLTGPGGCAEAQVCFGYFLPDCAFLCPCNSCNCVHAYALTVKREACH